MNAVISMEDKKRKWSFCFTEFLFGMVAATLVFNVLFLQTNGMNAENVGVIMSINSFMGMIAPLFWGVIADKIRSKYRVFILTLTAAGIVAAVMPVSSAIRIGGILLAGFMVPVLNFFRQPSYTVMDAMIVAASTQVQGMDYANVRVWSSIGYTLASTVYSPLISIFGIQTPYYGFAILTFLCLISCKHMKQYEQVNGERPKAIPLRELDWKPLFKNYYLISFLLINILLNIPSNVCSYLSFLLTSLELSTDMVGILNGISTAVEVLMLLFAPYLKRRLSLPAILTLSTSLYAIALFLFPLCTSIVPICFLYAMNGAAFGLVLSSAINYVNELAPRGLGATVTSMYAAGGALCGIISNLIGGKIANAIGVQAFYRLGSLITLLALALFLGSFFFGSKILKKKPPIPYFKHESTQTEEN